MDALTLQAIATAGGGLDISARSYQVLTLQAVASAGKAKGAALIIRDAGALPPLSAQTIATASPGNVIFVF